MELLLTGSVLPSSLVIFVGYWHAGFENIPSSSGIVVSSIALLRNVGFSYTPTTVCFLSRPLSMFCINVEAVLLSFIL